MRLYWRVLHYLKPYRGLAVASVLIIAATAMASLLTPWPLKILVDNALGGAPPPESWS